MKKCLFFHILRLDVVIYKTIAPRRLCCGLKEEQKYAQLHKNPPKLYNCQTQLEYNGVSTHLRSNANAISNK